MSSVVWPWPILLKARAITVCLPFAVGVKLKPKVRKA